MPSIKDRAVEAGLKPVTVYRRMKQGMTADEALKPVQENRYKNDNGLSPNLIYQRVHMLGWSEEKAMSTPKGAPKIRKLYSYQGNNVTIYDLEKVRGIHRSIISHRINSLGWDVERAATQEPVARMRQYVEPVRLALRIVLEDNNRNVIHKSYNVSVKCPICNAITSGAYSEENKPVLVCSHGHIIDPFDTGINSFVRV